MSTKTGSYTVALLFLMVLVFAVGGMTSERGGFSLRFARDNNGFDARQIANYSLDPLTNNICTTRFPQFKEFHSCLLSENSEPEILIVGDSHGNQYYQSIKKAYPSHVVMNISEYMCLPFVSDSILKENPVNCMDKIEIAKTFIKKSPSIKKVYVIGHWKLLLNIPRENLVVNLGGLDQENYDSFVRNGMKFIGDIYGSGKNIIFFGDNPDFDFDMRGCLSMRLRKFYEKSSKCEISLISMNNKNYLIDNAIEKILINFNKVKYFNPNNYLCNQEYCPIVVESIPLYMDRNHLNHYGAYIVVEGLRRSDW